MKNLKRSVLLLSLAALTCVPAAFGQQKIVKPRASEVAIVGRFSVVPALNSDFYWQAYDDATPRKKEKRAEEDAPGMLAFSTVINKKGATRESSVRMGSLGDQSVALVTIPADRTLYLMKYEVYLFNMRAFYLPLPIYCKIVIPEGAHFVYIGSVDYYTKGEFLDIKDANRRDEFDAAREFVRKNYGEDAQLVRVNLLDPDKDKDKEKEKE